MSPLISICIPSYGQPALLDRALQSILNQNYSNIEVVISDDTPDTTVKIIADKYASQLSLNYYKNSPALGTPANWNAALDKAKGQFLMLLHHDDWLANTNGLSDCIKIFNENKQTDVIFGRSLAISEKEKKGNTIISEKYFIQFYKRPFKLLLKNEIGIPSNIILRNTVKERYHLYYKWLVDLEFYIRLILAGHQFKYYDQQLIFQGLHPDQMTNFCKQDGDIIVKENIYFADQYLNKLENGIQEYDYFWRLLRNYKVTKTSDLLKVGLSEKEIPAYIQKIIKVQSKLPRFMLKGIFSKVCMTVSYFIMSR